jgi:hypothetical protein
VQIRLDNFEGIVPRVRDRLLGDNQAVVAENVDLRNGSLRPIREPGSVTSIPSGHISLYLYNDDFLSWETDVDVARGPIANDAFDRIYYTGDGAPKVLGTDGGVQKVFDLGIPKPDQTPTVTTQQKPEGGYTRSWGYFYEEPDGRQVDNGTLLEGVDVDEIEPGKEYRVASVPAKVSASPDAIFIMFFDATDSANGSALGRVYGNISSYTGNNDFVLQGAAASADQENVASSANFTLSFDTSRASDYTVDRAYVYTFVSAWGEEGAPSSPSDVVAIDPTEDAEVGNIQTAVAGNYQITKVRIYRTVTGTSGTSTFRFVDEIDIGTNQYLDSLTDAQTAEALPSEDWDAPPEDLIGLVAMANGFFAAFRPGGKDIYYSEPGFPHAFPLEYVQSVDYPIVGLGSYENSLLIATEGFPYLATGASPEFMNLQKLLSRESCVSKRSITNIGSAIAYASPSGIAMSVGADIQLITKPFYTEEEWRRLNPETMIGAIEDERLFMFGDIEPLAFEFGTERSMLVSNDIDIEGAYSDIETDTLYMIRGNSIIDWEGGTENKTMRWRSKRFVLSRVGDFTTGRILADGYPVTFRLFAEGVQVHEQVVNSDESFTIPVLRQEREWNVEIESKNVVTELVLADRRGLQQ